jgi:hypothetical protein
MDPVTGILMGASLLGGIISSTGGRKTIDPEWLKQHFGPKIVTDETMEYFNRILNSPQGQQMLSQAVSSGQATQNAIESRAAAAGMGPSGGAQSGSSIFSEAAAGQAPQNAANAVRGDIWSQSFNAAQQAVQNRMGTWAGLYAGQGPTTQEKLGAAIGGAAGMGQVANQQRVSATPNATMATIGSQGTQGPPEANPIGGPTPRNAAPSAPVAVPALQNLSAAAPGASDASPLGAAQSPRSMGRRFRGRIDRFTGGRSMSAIQSA